MLKRLLLSLGISIVSQVAVAQWTYILTINGNGALTVRKYGPYSTKEECERDRLYDIAANTWSSYLDGDGWGGTISVKATATPCTGPGSESIRNIDILGVSKGSSFYSTTGVDEIKNWSSDDARRRMALDPKYESKEPESPNTTDIVYDKERDNLRLSGKMPKGSTLIARSDSYYAQKRESRNNEYVIMQERDTKHPLLYELGKSSSDDLKPVEIPQGTIRLYGNVNNSERKESITDKVKSALISLDEKLDWYNAEDGNTFQYMYTRWGKENVMAGVDLWERHHVGERISNVWNKVKEVASDPLGALEKKREEIVDGINENKDDHIGSGILLLLKPQNQVAGENAQDTYSTLKGSFKFVFEDISKAPNYAASGKVPDYMKTIEKVGDDVSGLAGRVTERSAGLPNLSKISKPITDVYRQPREKQGKEIANITSKQIKKQTKSAVKKSEFYKSANGKFTNLLDPNHLVTE